MKPKPARRTPDLEAGDEVSLSLEADYVSGLLSEEDAAAVETALGDAPAYLAELQGARARVAALTTPKKLAAPSTTRATAGETLRKISDGLQKLFATLYFVPEFGSPLACHTVAKAEDSAGPNVEFLPDGSMEVRILSRSREDEGVSVEVNIHPLAPRSVRLARRAPASHEVAGKVVFTAEECRRLPPRSKISFRPQECVE